MINRRTVLTGTTVGGVLASLAPNVEAAPEPAAMQQSDQSVAALAAVARAVDSMKNDVTQAINNFRNEVRQNGFADVEAVRVPIRAFLRNSGKFPEYIEIGTDIWQSIYDWHIRFALPPVMARTPEGRYTIQLMSTICIMRVEMPPNYVGVPYDNR